MKFKIVNPQKKYFITYFKGHKYHDQKSIEAQDCTFKIKIKTTISVFEIMAYFGYNQN